MKPMYVAVYFFCLFKLKWNKLFDANSWCSPGPPNWLGRGHPSLYPTPPHLAPIRFSCFRRSPQSAPFGASIRGHCPFGGIAPKYFFPRTMPDYDSEEVMFSGNLPSVGSQVGRRRCLSKVWSDWWCGWSVFILTSRRRRCTQEKSTSGQSLLCVNLLS